MGRRAESVAGTVYHRVPAVGDDGRLRLVQPHRPQTAQHGEITNAVKQETGSFPNARRQHSSSEGRPNQARPIKQRRIEGDGVGQIILVASDHLRQKRLPTVTSNVLIMPSKAPRTMRCQI